MAQTPLGLFQGFNGFCPSPTFSQKPLNHREKPGGGCAVLFCTRYRVRLKGCVITES